MEFSLFCLHTFLTDNCRLTPIIVGDKLNSDESKRENRLPVPFQAQKARLPLSGKQAFYGEI